MARPGKIHLALYLFGFAGAALFVALLLREGAGQVASAFAAAGWGILAVLAFHLVPIFFDALAWWALYPKEERTPLRDLIWMRWIGESVSTLIPSASVGGTIVRARLSAMFGCSLRIAAGTVLVDLTLGVFVQIIFTLLGLWLLVELTGARHFIWPTILGTITGVLAGLGFYFVQRLGMFRLVGVLMAKFAKSPEWHALLRSGREFDETLRKLYARRAGVIGCCVWTIASLVLGSGEIWIALHALGVAASPLEALALHSSIYTIRSALFAVPGALGVQEGGYLLVGKLLGIPGETALALSLIARVRELALGVPGLLVWQFLEGRRALASREISAG